LSWEIYKTLLVDFIETDVAEAIYNIMFPAHRSFADPYDKIMVIRENPAKIPVWEKNPQVYHSLYSSIEHLQVAL
jgi:hypothetical protein